MTPGNQSDPRRWALLGDLGPVVCGFVGAKAGLFARNDFVTKFFATFLLQSFTVSFQIHQSNSFGGACCVG
jgi:hypothetical protein